MNAGCSVAGVGAEHDFIITIQAIRQYYNYKIQLQYYECIQLQKYLELQNIIAIL